MQKHLIKMIMKNGHALALYADDGTLDELVSHPKFLRMKDDKNDVFMSIEDVAAFEIVQEPPKQAESNETQKPTSEGVEPA